MSDIPQIFKIHRIIKQAKDIFSIILTGSLKCKPGQFIMVWLPDVEEKPMAVSYLSKTHFGFTFQVIGSFTKKLSVLSNGDVIGIRGPYGNSFKIMKNAAVVGGGVGLSPMCLLIDQLHNPLILHGARSKDILIFQNRFKMHIATDDGSYGYKGYITELLQQKIHENKIEFVYACGPEIMMDKVIRICIEKNIECQISLERYMKCGFGICGSCAINDKFVCIDGPIFNKREIAKLNEFAKFARLNTGKKVESSEYHAWRAIN